MVDDMEKTLLELDKKVSQITNSEKSLSMGVNISSENISKSYLPKINSNIIIYMLPPIIFLVVFIITKPSFIMNPIIVEGSTVDYKLNIKKMFIITIVLSLIIDFFIYKYKK